MTWDITESIIKDAIKTRWMVGMSFDGLIGGLLMTFRESRRRSGVDETH